MDAFRPYIKNISGVIIYECHLQIENDKFKSIIDNVDKQLLNILIQAEQEFGNLDKLDIEPQNKESAKFNKQIQIILNSIYIGNNNTIKKSDFTGNLKLNEETE